MEENIEKVENKSKIVPSYNKKNEIPQKPKKIKSKITIYILIAISFIIILGVIYLIYNLIITNKYKEYVKYENDMQNYGFNLMYDNSSANTYEKVTKSEMVKIIVSSLLNRYSIDDTWKIENKEYDNQIWVDYAEKNGLIDTNYINKDNQGNKATYMEAITLLSKYKQLILQKNLDIESNPKYKDFENYATEQQTTIRDMVWNKIIDDSNNNLNVNRNIVKGELNQLIIKFIEKYNTITIYSEDKLNINDEKLPYNYEDYTYTLANINKKVYEAKFDYKDVSKSMLPREVFIKYKDEIQDWIDVVTEYYNKILNIDYRTFNKEEFINFLNLYVYNKYSSESIDNYEKYIKDNEIVINGNSTAQMPIIYFDGENIRIRFKLQYNILSTKTRQNILFGDLLYISPTNYDKDTMLQYIDVKLMSNNDKYKDIHIGNSNISDILVKNLQ